MGVGIIGRGQEDHQQPYCLTYQQQNQGVFYLLPMSQLFAGNFVLLNMEHLVGVLHAYRHRFIRAWCCPTVKVFQSRICYQIRMTGCLAKLHLLYGSTVSHPLRLLQGPLQARLESCLGELQCRGPLQRTSQVRLLLQREARLNHPRRQRYVLTGQTKQKHQRVGCPGWLQQVKLLCSLVRMRQGICSGCH